MEDFTTDCDRFLDYCDKKRSNLSSGSSFSSFVYPDDFYNTVELMYERCFKSCSEHLPGGAEAFCSMPDLELELELELEQEEVTYTSGQKEQDQEYSEYCQSVDDNSWTDEMILYEEDILQVLNDKRDEQDGVMCRRKSRDGDDPTQAVTSTFFPRASSVVTNDSLRCSARIQAKNIVDATIANVGRFPSNLHGACPPGTGVVCEDFQTRMVHAGYSYNTNGFGRINEVTAAGYSSAAGVIQGWLDSTSGHCSAVMKQESLVVPTEVGIGYYKDEITGTTGHVMILAQRQL